MPRSNCPVQSLKELDKQEAELQKIQKLESAIKTLNDLDAGIDKQTKIRDLACMRAIGSMKYCGCIGKEMPWVFSFDDYVAITTKSKEINQYSKLDKETQAAYDKVRPIRDRCVATSFK
jgi:hypothetical protein